MKSLAYRKVQDLLNQVGIQINGKNSWDIIVHNDRFFNRILSKGSLGLGESYMDGWWDVKDLEIFFTKILRGKLEDHFRFTLPYIWLWLKSSVLNMQTTTRSQKVAKEHYNLGNDLYMSFLDPYNQYTCGYFKDTDDLDKAQENKLDLICQKLDLQETDHVLDIGCGWGGFSKFAAEHYGCKVTGVSISDEQIKYARKFCKDLPIEIIKQDYRKLKGTYDKVLVCGMIEHVGFRNYRKLMQKVRDVLVDDGLFLLHTIGSSISSKATDPWTSKYIFPNSMTPSLSQLTSAAENILVLEDLHNIGIHYVKTLKAWYERFHNNWDTLKTNYNERFYRMWTYYLLSSAGFFNSRSGQLWQIVYSKNGVPDGYQFRNSEKANKNRESALGVSDCALVH